MAVEADSGVTDKSKKFSSDGSYVLRTIVDSVPLASEVGSKIPQITCVELWGQSSTFCAPLCLDFLGQQLSFC